MARLITKFKYLKPNARKSVGGYAKYIATREGVEKIDESYKLQGSSKKQQQLIEKIIRDFPDGKEMLEYEDYLNEPTVGSASEFITCALGGQRLRGDADQDLRRLYYHEAKSRAIRFTRSVHR